MLKGRNAESLECSEPGNSSHREKMCHELKKFLLVIFALLNLQ